MGINILTLYVIIVLTLLLFSSSGIETEEKSISQLSQKSSSDTSDKQTFSKSNFTLNLSYSCADCDFKSTNPISLRDHRIKDHSPKSEPPKRESVSNMDETTSIHRQLNGKNIDTSNVNESFTSIREQPNGKNMETDAPFRRFKDKHGSRWYYFCNKCTSKTDSKYRAYEHDNEKHDGNHDLTKIPRRRSNSVVASDSSAPHSVNGVRRKKRKSGNIYSCRKCSTFKTPNARILKNHLRHKHGLTLSASFTPSPDQDPNILDNNKWGRQIGSLTPSPDQDPTILNSSNIKSGRLNGRTFYKCPSCHHRAHSTQQVIEHFCRIHTPTNPSPPTSTEQPKDEKYRCLICCFETTDAKLLEKHNIQRHSGDELMDGSGDSAPKYSCRSCFFTTPRKSLMKSHEKLHKYKSAFQCSICSYSVDSEKKLEAHLYTHHRAGFACKFCEFRADTKGQLKKHVDSAHETGDAEIEHVCSHCNFKTPSRDDFISHEVNLSFKLNLTLF